MAVVVPAWLAWIQGTLAFVVAAALLAVPFTLLHHFKGGVVYILFAKIAGLFYGYVFEKTRRLDAGALSFQVNPLLRLQLSLVFSVTYTIVNQMVDYFELGL